MHLGGKVKNYFSKTHSLGIKFLLMCCIFSNLSINGRPLGIFLAVILVLNNNLAKV